MDTEEVSKVEGTVEEPTTIEGTTEETNENNNEPKLAKVEYDFEARNSDELSLDRGDIVTLLEQNDGGWWKGDLNGKIGVFPSNHVKLIEVPSQPAEDVEDVKNPDGVKKKTLNKYGVKAGGLGSLFSGGGITFELKKRSQPSLENSSGTEEKHQTASVPTLRKTSASSKVPQLPPKKKPSKPNKVEPKAIVTFDYDADGDDEISLVTGTYVTILEKIEEKGWWNGRNEQGKIGMFPSTYVEEISPAEVQQKSRSVSEEVIESKVEEVERHESPEIQATNTQEEVPISEPTHVSDSSSPSIHSNTQDISEIYGEDSPTLPNSPPPLTRRKTNESSSSSKSNRRSTYDTSQVRRRSTHEPSSPSSPRRNSSHEGEEHMTNKRPPSVVSPDLPPIQSITTKRNSVSNIDATPTSPEERPTVPPRQTDSPKSPPPLAKPPVPKNFSPAKPPVIPPIKRSSSSASKSDKVKNETSSPTEPVSPKINRRVSYDSYTEEPENKEEDEEKIDEVKIDEVVEKPEEKSEDTTVEEEKIDNKETEISEEKVDDKEDITEPVETEEDEGNNIGGHEIEPEEKKPPPQLPPLPSGPKLANLGKDRPAVKNRKTPSVKSMKENASQSQTAMLLEAVTSAKEEEEQKPPPVTSPPMPPKPEKPEKPVKPSAVRLPVLGSVQLRPVSKKPPIETSTETTETTTSSTTSSGIDTKPISGGVKGISSRFNQFGGIPNSSDVEFRLKKLFNEEINKVKSHFEAQLAEERSKREALEEEFKELVGLVTSLQSLQE